MCVFFTTAPPSTENTALNDHNTQMPNSPSEHIGGRNKCRRKQLKHEMAGTATRIQSKMPEFCLMTASSKKKKKNEKEEEEEKKKKKEEGEEKKKKEK